MSEHEPKDETESRSSKLLPEALRKAVAAGVGAVFLTEEGIRSLVSELKLPKEAMSFLLQQADRTRTEVMNAVGKEVKRYMKSSELEKLLGDMLENFTIEVKAEVRFKTNDKGKLGLAVTSSEVARKPTDSKPTDNDGTKNQ